MEQVHNLSNPIIMKNLIRDDKFINLINTLSDSIKEYYKVTKNVNQNETILMNSFQKAINNSDSLLNIILKEGINNDKINNYNNAITNVKEALSKLHLNIVSNYKNLSFFFEDAKILFKKMKEERQKLLLRMTKRFNTSSKEKDSINKMNSKFKCIKYNKYNSNINSEILKYNNNTIPNDKKVIFQSFRHMNNEINKRDDNYEQKVRSNSYQRKEILEEVNNSLFRQNIIPHIKGLDFNMNQNKEIERLDKLNKKYESYIKKLNNELKKYQSQKNNFINDTSEKRNQSKDKIILSLKENLKLNNKKYIQLLNNFNSSQNLLKKLTEENNQLRNNASFIKNNNINNNDLNQNLYDKMNKIIKENDLLKNKLESLKKTISIPKSYINLNINNNANLSHSEYNLNNTNKESLKKNVELLKKKVTYLEIQLSDEQKKNKELINENLILKKKENELSQIYKKNTDRSKKLLDTQKELLKLQKENIDKNKELESLKISLDSAKNNGMTDNPQNNFAENYNKIIEKYKSESDNLKTENNILQDKIKYYQTQLKKKNNELYEKIKENIELPINSDKKIKDMKDDYDKKIEEMNNKNKSIENNLEECQKFNNDLIQQINDLNQQIIAKDIIILELNYQKEQSEKNISNKEEENKKLQESNKSSQRSNQQIDIYKDLLEEEKKKSNDFKDKMEKIKKDNEILSKKIANYEENMKQKENSNKVQNNEINKEMEKLKKENENFKINNEKLNKEIKEILKNNKVNETNSEILKSQSDELEGLKELVIKFQNETKKADNEIKTLKKENEKLKTQLIRLSKSFPEEYNELLKEYNELESKYKLLLKNKSNNIKLEGSSIHSISTNRNNKDDDNLNELNKAKKEIEIIKKKNMELVKQLEEKEIKKDCYDNKSEQNVSNYEEEFDLKKMAKGAKDKNRSQDINIDYPGIQPIKEKYRELDFYYNSLEGLVKKLLLNIYCNPKNKTYISELCKIVGFDADTTNKILNNKNKNFIFGLFNK